MKKNPSKSMIEDGGQHGINVSDGMQQSLGLAWNSKMTISVKTGPIQKHLRRKKLVVKLVDLLLLCEYCTILNVQYLIFSLIIAYCTPLELKEKWLHSKIIFLGYKNEVSIIQWGYAVVFKIIFIHIQQMTTNHGEFPLWWGFKKQR